MSLVNWNTWGRPVDYVPGVGPFRQKSYRLHDESHLLPRLRVMEHFGDIQALTIETSAFSDVVEVKVTFSPHYYGALP